MLILPLSKSWGETSPDRSGSSPYQNIHNSFEAFKESAGGKAGTGVGGAGTKGSSDVCWELAGGNETRLHTANISCVKHLV